MTITNITLKTALLSLAILLAGAIHLSATVHFFQKWLPPFGLINSIKAISPEATGEGNAIQIALLLDTSNSMDGLIEQAKSQLWKILNELARSKKDGNAPVLQIALYEYGNSGLSSASGHIRQVQPFTTDMDLVSEKLFSLSTNGGNEYCGQVIHTALEELQWTTQPGALRVIYIAGNEPFTQGAYPYAEACAWAKEKDVVINTIFCGNYEAGVSTQWQSGAVLGKGSYSNIDHNAQTTFIETPYDNQITQFNLRLNATYIAYGAQGQDCKANQAVQDQNALKYSEANVADRALFKCSANYTNAKWDLVDAYKKDRKVLEKPIKNLPDSLKHMGQKTLEKEVQRLVQERENIQQKIRELGEKRRAYMDAERAKTAGEGAKSLESSILKALHQQAKQKSFIIE